MGILLKPRLKLDAFINPASEHLVKVKQDMQHILDLNGQRERLLKELEIILVIDESFVSSIGAISPATVKETMLRGIEAGLDEVDAAIEKACSDFMFKYDKSFEGFKKSKAVAAASSILDEDEEDEDGGDMITPKMKKVYPQAPIKKSTS